MNWSKFQQAVFDFVENIYNGSCVINAVAGSGKTTTIVECAIRAVKQFPAKLNQWGKYNAQICFMAFNNSIVKELTAKIEKRGVEGVEVKTLHSQGRSALAKKYYSLFGHRVPQDWVDAYKWTDIINRKAPELTSASLDEDEIPSFCTTCKRLFDKCRVELVKGGETRRIDEVAEHYGIDLYFDEVEVVSELLRTAYSATTDNLTKIDYTDMICISATSLKSFVPKYEIVFVDECQDLNNAQRELLLNSMTPNGRFVAVGDPKQAINGFAGASCNSFALLKALANGKELPLSVCYRCGSKIIDLAKRLVPNICSANGAIEGEISHTKDLTTIKGGDMVLCRKTAPLVSLCLKYLANGVLAQVKGKEVLEGIVTLINKTKAKSLDSLTTKLNKELTKMANNLAKKGVCNVDENPKYVALSDKIDCILAVAEKCTKVSEVVDRLSSLFADKTDTDAIVLSTIHKAKGLEADNVYIIVPDKLPLTYKGQKEWEYAQELNLKYVAITRAKKHLTFVDLTEEQLTAYQFTA